MFLLLLACLPMVAGAQVVKVVDVQGNQAQFNMSATGGIYFESDSLVVRTSRSEEPVRYALDAVAQLLFDETQGIAVVEAEEAALVLWPNPVDEAYTIGGLPEGSHLMQVHDMAGHLVEQRVVCNGMVVSAAGLQAGIYMVSVGGKAVKMVKR